MIELALAPPSQPRPVDRPGNAVVSFCMIYARAVIVGFVCLSRGE